MATANMTETYERAVTRAQRDGIVIVGRGFRKADGVVVVYTSSASGDTCHAVAVHADHMTCDCAAHGYCKHRAIVRADLVAKALAATARLERTPSQPVAPVQAPRPQVRGVNDTRPITIWAA